MSTLQVTNITGISNLASIQLTANSVTANSIIANSVTANTLTVTTVSANGTLGTENQVLTSNGSTSYWSTPEVGKNYAITGSMQKSSFLDATTYYFGAHPQITLQTTAGQQRVYIPSAGTISSVYFSAFNASGVTGSSESTAIYLRVNNTTDYVVNNAFTLSMTANTGYFFSNTAMSIAVNAGDYFEFKQVSPTWVTNPTNVSYGWLVYIT